MFDEPAAVLMERARNARDVFEYLVLDDMERKEFTDANAKDWAPVGTTETGATMLFEKPTGRRLDSTVASAPPRPVFVSNLRQLDTMRPGTMQKELTEAAAQGYRLMRTPFTEPGLTVTMEKVGEPPAAYEYLVIAEKQDTKMEAALNDAAGKGFRVVPGTMATALAAFGTEPVVLLEKVLSGTPPAVKYRVIGASRLSTFNAELDKARQEGGELVGIVGSLDKSVTGPHVAILERPAAK